MVAMTKCVKTFEVIFNDPSKTFYCSGDKVAGTIVVEVTQVTRVSSMRVLGVGCARVGYSKGKQRCRQETEYLKYEDVLFLDDQPIGESGQHLTLNYLFQFYVLLFYFILFFYPIFFYCCFYVTAVKHSVHSC